jgi:hypothetical protein
VRSLPRPRPAAVPRPSNMWISSRHIRTPMKRGRCAAALSTASLEPFVGCNCYYLLVSAVHALHAGTAPASTDHSSLNGHGDIQLEVGVSVGSLGSWFLEVMVRIRGFRLVPARCMLIYLLPYTQALSNLPDMNALAV